MTNTMISRFVLIIIALTALSVSGCAKQNEQDIRDGREYGRADNSFKGHWWDYYERGRSFADRKLYTEAIADFRKAVEGRDTDQWRVSITDIEVIDYFPHRELGVVYCQRKKYAEAIAELEQSIQSAPSAKGHYFLNKARAAKLRAESRDMFPPELYLDGNSGKRTANDFTTMIKGVAVDDTSVASIRVGNIHVPIELAVKQRVFTVEIPLIEGENIIPISVTDLVGKTTEQNLEIFCDMSGPLVEVLQVTGDGENRVISGVVSDTGGLQSLTVNGNPWEISGESSAYNFKFAQQKDEMTLVATDRAGNVTRAVLSDNTPEDDPLLHPRHARFEPSPPSQPFAKLLSDPHTPQLSSHQAPEANTDPPVIQLKGLFPNQETYENFIPLAAMVVDLSPIHFLSINGDPIANKNGRKLYFSQMEKLAEGHNAFIIVAIDAHGNRSERVIKITRKIRNIDQIGSRLSMAILPFDHQGMRSPVNELIFAQLIASFRQQKRFNVVEQQKIDTSFPALAPDGTNVLDLNKAVVLGRTIDADTVLTGTVIESPDSVEIIGRLIDTESAAILSRHDTFTEDKSQPSLENQLDRLAFKFKQDFPLIKGIVTDVKGDEVVIDIGSKEKIKPNQHLILYRKGLEIKHPVTGQILGAEPEILGELTVKEVFENFSKATMQNRKATIQVYDQVIAR